MVERVVFMQTEDKMVTFERENGDTIIYPKKQVPKYYKQGDIIKVIIHSETLIDFFGLDVEEMERRQTNAKRKRTRLKNRTRRTTTT